MNKKGFTLIELIMVIVILGLLAVVAIPKYRDLRSEASRAAADGVFAAAQGAAAINFSTRLVTPSAAGAVKSNTRLLAAMAGTPDGWASTGSTQIYATVGGDTYVIGVSTIETPDGANAPATRATVSKSW